MSFSFTFITNSADRANALTAAQSPPEPVAAFIASAVAAFGPLPAGALIEVDASGHLDAAGGATSTPPAMPVAQTASITVSMLMVTE